ncbi:uncharacterized protein F5147DRAFT_770991 [Suillus discolor]|uniref:Uncharacterized protein n=1 Tax=Suillus discolor TaxID=1912936 RepID=A0A9P7JWW9_9AGAM|nr:uncharacterized protein F5147DRAFT_770991 [Suillus discolor]KAG2113133.1 hypothetical protein F5147DRAFT_770991 [Suillus discolor]
MSNNGAGSSQAISGTSQTASSGADEIPARSDSECVEKCNELVEQYRRRENAKADTILALHQVLLESSSIRIGGSLPEALAVYVDMLDSVDRANGKAAERGNQIRGTSPQEAEEKERADSESSDEDEPRIKRSRGHLDTSKFPWHKKRVTAIASLAPDIKQTFDQLERFAVDPKAVVRDILSTPGCPPFPPEQWLNIVQWKVVDLGKVLEATHSTDLEPKQTHIIDDKIITSPSPSTLTPSPSSFHNIGKSTPVGTLTCRDSFTLSKAHDITVSSSTTKQSAPWCHSNDTYASLIIPHLGNSNTLSCPPLAWVPIPPNQTLAEEGSQIGRAGEEQDETLVISGTEGRVPSPLRNVSSPIAVTEKVVAEPTRKLTVRGSVRAVKDQNSLIAAAPSHRRKNIWNDRSHPRSPTATWTETAKPLPRPPKQEFKNLSALRTISDFPHLFRVSTCINIEEFESLLSDHPNPAFVNSVCLGLREGFWPFADTHYGEWPLTFDNSSRPLKSDAEKEFVKSQIDKEVALGRYSEEFGPDLLPGMYSMLVHAVPKPGTSKFHLVTDHSAGLYALNSMISRDDIAGVTLDNVHHLGNGLRHYCRSHLGGDLQLWKADVSEAYRHMPMHLLWQIKQVVILGE